MIKFMVLSCSAVRVVCQISNGVLIMILHQVHFIGGLKSSDNRPAMRYWNTSSLEYIPVTLKVVEYVSLHYVVQNAKQMRKKQISYMPLSHRHYSEAMHRHQLLPG